MDFKQKPKGGSKRRVDEQAGASERTSRDRSRSRSSEAGEAGGPPRTSRDDSRSRIGGATEAFKAPAGRAVQRKPGPKSRTSSASSSDGSVRGGEEPGPSTSGRGTPVAGRKRKAEPIPAPMRGVEGAPVALPPPVTGGGGVRGALETGSRARLEGLDADTVVEETRRHLEHATSLLQDIPYDFRREGVTLSLCPDRLGRAREGAKKIGEAVEYLYDLAKDTVAGLQATKIRELHEEFAGHTREISRLREEVRSLRAQLSAGSAAGSARGAGRGGGGARAPPPAPPKGVDRGPGQQARKKKRGGGASRSVSRPRPPPLDEAAFPPLSKAEREWKKVERRKRRKAGRPPEGGAPPAAKPPTSGAKKAAPPAKAEQTKRRRRRNVPQTAAVTITATAGLSYADLINKAREGVSLAEIGIEDMTLKRARNGGYLFEIPGTDGPDKADRLARELEEVLSGAALVARPVKCAELRVTGLDDSVAPEEIERALCATGECARSSLRLGNIRRAANGLGAVWVRCPLAAALRLEKAGRIKVGWTHAVVRRLEDRPLQCYKCLHWGHTAAACKGRIDRSGRCFNCGGVDHVARDCVARSRCPVCDVAGEPADHRMGGPACATLKKRVAKKKDPPLLVKMGGIKMRVGKPGGKGGGDAPRPPAAAKARPVEPPLPPREPRPPAAAKARPAPPPREPSPAPEGMEVSPLPGPGEEDLTWEVSQSQHYPELAPSQDRAEGCVVVLDDDDPSQVPQDLQLGDWGESP